MKFINKDLQGTCLFLMVLATVSACQKSFLDTKPSSSIVVPSTITDFKNILEYSVMYNSTSALPQMAADEYYFLNYSGYLAVLTETERQSYIWAKDVFGGEVNRGDWNTPYQAVFYANNVIEGLGNLEDSTESDEYKLVKGWAYFVRAYEFYDLARNFAKLYDSSTAKTDLGIPLKLRAGIDNIEKRSSVQETYDQIFADLDIAEKYLSPTYPTNHQNQPSKIAVYALKARIYHSIGNYEYAGLYADSSLRLYSTLIDYNSITTTSNYPFPTKNTESIYTTSQVLLYGTTLCGNNKMQIAIDSNLLSLYRTNDLRTTVFFKTGSFSNRTMRGGYYGTGLYPYSGLAVDEMYLIRSESNARSGNKTKAMEDLNTLLKMRFKSGMYQSLTDTTNVLDIVLEERRKELVWRGLRWQDIKRLNKEGANIILKRVLDGTVYTLPANDPKYIFNIPEDEITLSGIEQNDR